MIIRLRKPDVAWLDDLRAAHADAPLSYAAAGASLDFTVPDGFVATEHACRLADGSFEAAKAVIDSFGMFPSWVTVRGDSNLGSVVAVVAHFGVEIVNLCRIVQRIDTPDRYGFIYGTLDAHAECGEEIFSVERRGDEVWYRVFSFSKPAHPLVWLGYPLTRALQKRFVRDSGAAVRALTG